ncbi:MAG: pentapeptide repeat-containing protein [Nitrosopumilus sp.]
MDTNNYLMPFYYGQLYLSSLKEKQSGQVQKGLDSMKNKLKFLLPSLLVFFIIISSASLSFAQEDTGSIDVIIRYNTFDKIDTYAAVLKVYQDNNKDPFVVIRFPESNPIMIDSLPLGHKYKVEVYVNGMLAGSEKIDVNGNEEMEIIIPTSGGMIFRAVYNDGSTAIVGATISIFSDDTQLWVQDTTDTTGKTMRFWLQSNNAIDGYYVAEVIIDGSVVFTSPKHIKYFPNLQGVIQINTSWPKIVDKLITVSVYKDASQKVTKSDGSFVVELYDVKNNKVDQSSVSYRGEAHFTNLKVGQYSFKAIKQPSDTNSEAIVIGVTNSTITGKESTIVIIGQESTTQGPQKTCNCVAFRLDDVQDHYLKTPQLEVMKIFQKKGVPLTLGIIGGFWGQDQQILNFIKEDIKRHRPTFEIASHSWNNFPLPTFNKNDQLTLLQKTNDVIQETLGVTPTTFTAVENKFNNDTITILQELGFTHFTAHIRETHSPPYALENSDLYYFPASTQTAILDVETNVWTNVDNEITFAEARDFLKEYGFAVVMMHPYEFAIKDFGVYTGEANFESLDNLGKLIDQFRDDGIDVVSIQQITEERIPGDEDIELELPQIEDSISNCNQSLIPFVDLSDCDLKGKFIQDVDLGDSNLMKINLSGTTIKNVNLANSILSGANFTGADISGTSLANADLRGADLTNATIKETDLRSANLSGAILENVIFKNLDAKGANFAGANMSGSIFKGVGLSNANLTGADLSLADLSGLNLSYTIIKDVDLSTTNITGANFYRSVLSNSNLTGADFSGSNISEADLTGADLTNAKLQKASLLGSILAYANLTGADFSGSNISEADLTGADLTNAKLQQVSLLGSILAYANLTGADFSGSNLSNADLTGADLTNANLSETNLIKADMSNAIIKDVNFSNANMKGINLSENNLLGIYLANSILSGANFTGADLSGSNLSNADLTGADLTNANLKGADFSGANLSGATLENANLSNADLSGSNLSNADLTGADLTNANLRGVDLRNAKLKGADFSGADLSNAEINLLDLESAITDSTTKRPETGFFFFREIFEFFKSLFGWS